MTDNRREAELLIAEVEEDAFAAGAPGLTLDQRLYVAGIRASLAQCDAIKRQAAAMETANVNSGRMVAILEAQSAEVERDASPTSAAPVPSPTADEHDDRPGESPASGRSASQT